MNAIALILIACLPHFGECKSIVQHPVPTTHTECSERAAKLVEIVLVGKPGRLVEPFRHQQLGRSAFAFAAIRKANARAHEKLRRLSEGHHAKAERQAQLHRTLVEFGMEQASTNW